MKRVAGSYGAYVAALLLAGSIPAALHAREAFATDFDGWRYTLEVTVFNRAGDTLREATVTAVDLGAPVDLGYDSSRAVYFRASTDHKILEITASAPGYETQRRKVYLFNEERVTFILGRPGDRYLYLSYAQVPYIPDTMALGFKLRDSLPGWSVSDYPQDQREGAMRRFQEWKKELWDERLGEIADEADLRPDDIELIQHLSPWGRIVLRDASRRRDVLRALRELPFIEFAGPLLSREPAWALGNDPYLSILPNWVAVSLIPEFDPEIPLDSIVAETGWKLAVREPEQHRYIFVTDPSVAEDINDAIAAVIRKRFVEWAFIQTPIIVTYAGR